jgi:hypothetical protein
VTAVTCEICGKSPAEVDVWTLCSECAETCRVFLQFVKQHNVDAKDFEPLKEALRSEARGIVLFN